MPPNISSLNLKDSLPTGEWSRLWDLSPVNTFMCNIEKQLETKNKMPEVYKRCIDDTLSVMNDVETTSEFLTTLKNSHQSIDFTIELEENGRLSFLGMEVMKMRMDAL